MARIRKALQTATKHIWRIALYIRLSKEDGNDESLSVSNQRKILLEYVEQFFQEQYILVDMYVEMKIPKVIQFENMNPLKKA